MLMHALTQGGKNVYETPAVITDKRDWGGRRAGEENLTLTLPCCWILKTKHIQFMIKITNKSKLLTLDFNYWQDVTHEIRQDAFTFQNLTRKGLLFERLTAPQAAARPLLWILGKSKQFLSLDGI